MGIVEFMRGTAGRAARIIAGIALILIGLAAIGGPVGILVAVIGVIPIAAGAFNFCLLGPVLGLDLHGQPRRQAGH
ncbi:DUF2892 domain-containing protein [Nocardia farcinica]|uniref:Inner membrane protein YgaP-like transmembrane domain-containing protein n=2 Tax=Nocardia TaxID=1817 RepID=Q5YM38_NOCFA|nr:MULTISPECIES: DUF2892 domain-containing protein [Nocardia]PEH74488.1 DUF2892 domain-containing protein [Nocardia sp. FDAARGOS_372]MBF6189146.1 DUF2892 domain-containing protein [Nocardia farcinica]MBF6246342.1 DUF2892 domain-containing protein [Nocardia elegans]MBF6314971.1 DUF2892 domain-containing protein [Nocardia farcinica]MBF6411133.1 DUF2892 domain-containing protein [Nocardia farcinica]